MEELLFLRANILYSNQQFVRNDFNTVRSHVTTQQKKRKNNNIKKTIWYTRKKTQKIKKGCGNQ